MSFKPINVYKYRLSSGRFVFPISIIFICFFINISHAEKCENDLPESIYSGCDLLRKLKPCETIKYIGVYKSIGDLANALSSNGYTHSFPSGRGACTPDWGYLIQRDPPYLYKNIAYGFYPRYAPYNCPPPPDSDSDGTADKDDLYFIKPPDIGFGSPTAPTKNGPCPKN